VGLLGNQGGSGDGADGTDWYNFKSTSPNQYQTTHACNAGDEVTVTGWYEQNNTGIMIIAFTTAPPGSTGTVVPGTAIGTPAELHTAGTGGGHAWIPFSHSETAPSGTTSYALGRKTSSISFDEVRVTIGTPVEGTNPLHGTDGTAAHCDHIHHVFSDVDPTVDDDESEGYRAGTFWVNTDTGDVFILLDATDGAADWMPVGGGGSGDVATDAIWDAKGDLAVGTGADTADNLAVGANDTILMADSAQTTGLKWVASGTPSTQAFGDPAAVGTADTFTRGDHKHAMPADPVTAHAAASDPHTGYVLESLVDAKGDLLTATADNTPARLAVGSNGKILVADSAESTGLKWATGGSIAVTVAGNLGDIPPSSPGTYDEEFLGTADTLPTDWAWTSAPSGSDEWKLNSRWPSLLIVQGAGNTSYTLTRSNFNAAATFSIWGKFLVGPFETADKAQIRMYAFNSGLTEGRAVTYRATGSRAAGVRALRTISNVESVWGTEKTGMEPGGGTIYLGFLRTSNNFESWYSRDGVSWDQLAGSQSHTFTIDRLRFSITTGTLTSLIGIDWIRYRTDTAFPRP